MIFPRSFSKSEKGSVKRPVSLISMTTSLVKSNDSFTQTITMTVSTLAGTDQEKALGVLLKLFGGLPVRILLEVPLSLPYEDEL